MDSDFCKKMVDALGVEPVPLPCPVQVLFNHYLKHLDSRVIHTPLPEKVYLRAENFPYWIKLENPNPANLSQWIPSKANVVVPMLEAGNFDQTGFRFDETRAKALFNVPELLQMPNCIHRNLRNHAFRGQGGIKGDHMYVSYYGKKSRKVAFTIFDQALDKVILVSSFWTYRGWVEGCAHMPAVYTREGRKCSCQ